MRKDMCQQDERDFLRIIINMYASKRGYEGLARVRMAQDRSANAFHLIQPQPTLASDVACISAHIVLVHPFRALSRIYSFDRLHRERRGHG